jgi:hypothetical protein
MGVTKNAGGWLGALLLGTVLMAQAAPMDTAQDLTAVIALQGKPCGQVINFTKLGDNDYLARCSSGDTYRVYVNERGRVVVEKK